MGFGTGRVTFCRYRVVGDAPVSATETILGTLADHTFKEQEFGTPDEVESGFISSSHLYDTEFSFENNVFGNPAGSVLLFAVRIDTHQVPADVKFAHRKMQEKSMAELNPSGFATRAQKMEAKDAAERDIRDDLAAGKYRKSKAVPMMWDLSSKRLYAGASTNQVFEQIARLMAEAFNVTIEPLSSGTIGELAFGANHRDFEDLQPSRFTSPPPESTEDFENADGPADINTPVLPWTHASISTRDFLGNEMLVWLWYLNEAGETVIRVPEYVNGEANGKRSNIAIVFHQSLDMDCAWDVRGKQSLRSSKPTRLPESAEALATGKWPRKVGMIIADDDDGTQWELTLQADRFNISGAALPKIEEAETPREALEQRLELITRLGDVLDGIFHAFMTERMEPSWESKRQAIREWITQRRKKFQGAV